MSTGQSISYNITSHLSSHYFGLVYSNYVTLYYFHIYLTQYFRIFLYTIILKTCLYFTIYMYINIQDRQTIYTLSMNYFFLFSINSFLNMNFFISIISFLLFTLFKYYNSLWKIDNSLIISLKFYTIEKYSSYLLYSKDFWLFLDRLV